MTYATDAEYITRLETCRVADAKKLEALRTELAAARKVVRRARLAKPVLRYALGTDADKNTSYRRLGESIDAYLEITR